ALGRGVSEQRRGRSRSWAAWAPKIRRRVFGRASCAVSCPGTRQAVGWDVERVLRLPVFGPGTQRARLWGTTCCVPNKVITPNVEVVKPLHVSDRLRLRAQADGPGQDPDARQEADRDADIDRRQHAV